MSCYMVGDKHLSCLVAYACSNALRLGEPNVYELGKEQEVVTLLDAANAKSVNARYGFGLTPEAKYTPRVRHLEPVEVLKACDCYEYQCHNWDGYEGSKADRFIQALRAAAIRSLPGYDRSRWHIV